MITSTIVFQEPEKTLVDTYNIIPKQQQNPKYWESDEVTPVRALIKQFYEQEQSYRCCYCNMQLLTNHGRVWDAEHVVPKSTHPQFLFEPQNLAASCIDCNDAKRHTQVLVNANLIKYPRRSEAFKIVHPHFDDFNMHIGILYGRIYFPKSSKGSFTYITCQLDRYAYKHVGWDAGLADSKTLVDKFNDLMEATDENMKKLIKLEILGIVQITTSRSLLSLAEKPVEGK